MNGVMNIRIQVMANQARQAINQVQGDISRLSAATAAGNAATVGASGAIVTATTMMTRFGTSLAGVGTRLKAFPAGMSAMGASMVKAGSQMQWVGRQLTYNITLPLALAGAAGVKFATDNDKAMRNLQKVYGDASMSTAQVTSETTALGKAFEDLSNIYGVARSEVIGIGAAWAAAGSSGLALAKQTKLTMDMMVLGEMNAADATQALIAIQAQYGFNADQLTTTIAQLNNVENQTGTTMADLVTAMSKSAGVAKSTGVDVAHLAAMTAALVPAAGTAAQAGNALKTIISRLLAPTSDAADLMTLMGINIQSTAWQSSDASTRLKVLSTHFENLSDAQKVVVSTTLASRYQLNKFDVLMGAIANTSSYYYKALDAANNKTQAFAQYTRELNMVLDSDANKFARAKVMLENVAADAIVPLMPLITGLAAEIAKFAQKFENLSPQTQKMIIAFGLFFALLGPIYSRLGALRILLGLLWKGFALLITPITMVVGTMFELVGATVAWLATKLAANVVLLWGVVAKTGPVFEAMGAGLIAFYRGTSILAIGLNTLAVEAWAGLQAAWQLLWAGLSSAAAAGGRLLVGMWRAMWVLLEGISIAVGQALEAIWLSIQGAMAAITTVGGALIRREWALAMTALEVLTAELGGILASIWAAIWTTLQGIAGFGWGLILAVSRIAMGLFETVLLTGAAAAGGIWRGLQAMLAAIQVAGGRLLAVTMAAVGAGLTAIWEAIQTALAVITSISWSNIGSLVARGGTAIWGFLTKLGPMLLSALTNPWVLGAVAVLVAIYALRDKLKAAWNAIVGFFSHMVSNVLNAFHALPQGVQNSIMAVVNVVASAAKAVYHWFSYLNPFAHHSPSLVENVTAGMAAVRAQFGTLTQIEGPVSKAYASLARFKSAALELGGALKQLQLGQDLDKLAKAGAPAAAIAGYKDLFNQVTADQKQADGLSEAIRGQQAIVDNWQRALDNANATLDAQKTALSTLQDQASKYKDAISNLTDDISNLAQTPIQGMQAMSDAIFQNEQAQKALQLQMDKLADAGGKDYGSIQNAVASLQGEIESLQGKEKDLRAAGAGSEILGQFDQQIKGLQDQQKAFEANGNQISDLNNQLSDLQHQADEMNLEQSLQFDPLTRQINQMANGMKELPFDQIVQGIQKDKQQLKPLQDAYAAVNDQITAQQAKVDQAQAAVDSIQKSYDTENDKLKALKDSYDAITQAIQDMSSAMSDATSAADTLSQAGKGQTAATKNFDAAAGGDFTDVGGTAGVGREGGMGDQSASIDQWIKDTQKKMGGAFTGIDMFGPFKDMWKSFTSWWSKNATPFLGGIGTLFKSAFSGMGGGGMFDGIKKAFANVDWAGMLKSTWSAISSLVGAIFDWAGVIWKYLGPSITNVFKLASDFFKKMFGFLAQVWGDVAQRIGPFMQAIKNIIAFLKPVVAFLLGEMMIGIKTFFQMIVNIGKPVLDWVVAIFKDVWNIVLGIIDVFIGIFTGDWGRLWDGIKEIFGGAIGIIWDTLKMFMGVIIGIFKTIGDFIGNVFSFVWNAILKPVFGWIMDGFEAVGNFFVWVWNNLLHPYIQMWIDIFKFLWNYVLSPIFSAIKTGFEAVGSFFKWVWNTLLKPIIQAYGDFFTWIWDHALKPIFDALKTFLSNMGGWWDSAVTSIKNVWAKIEGYAKTPVQWVIDVVWNNGLRSLWNTINNLWGGTDIAPFRFAAGGVLPGYTPGRDVHKFVSPTGGRLDLSGGEAVMVPQFTKALGPGMIDLLNRVARMRGPAAVQALMAQIFGAQAHAAGGIINLPSWMQSVISYLPFGNQIMDILGKITGNAGPGMFGQIFDLAKGMGGKVWDSVKGLIGDLGDLAKRFGKKVLNGIGNGAKNAWNWITGPFDGGGILGSGKAGYNQSGQPERILSPRQTAAFDKLVKILDDLDLVDLEARINGSESANAGVTYVNNDNSTTININGDLSFPNITNGDDAEVFIRNLGDMAGSGALR